MEISELQNNLGKELITNTQGIICDIAEIGLDSIFDDGVLKEVPILKTIAAVCKVGLNIRDRHFSKKLINFINEYHKMHIDSERLFHFKEKMRDKKYRDKVTEKLIVIIDRLDEVNKSKILAILFNSFIEQKITWDEFCMFSKYIDLLKSDDYATLKFLVTDVVNGFCISTTDKKHLEGSANKLIYFGFVKKVALHSMTFGTMPTTEIHSITEDGIKFIGCFDDGDWV